MSNLTAPIFDGSVVQCRDVVVSWTGGEYPVRVEAFYQPDATSDWKIAGLPSEAADSNVIRWNANVPAGSFAWITLIDHSGTYKQTSQGVLVGDSGDASCLDNAKTASVVTQTVFMSGDGSGSEAHLSSGLDDKALLILSVAFGIVAFASLAMAFFLFSKLRQARRARMRGPRFSLADEDLQAGSTYASRRSLHFSPAMFANGTIGKDGRSLASIDTEEVSGTAPPKREASAYAAEKGHGSPDASFGEHNPFLDPPLSARSDDSENGFPSRHTQEGTRSSRQDSFAPLLPPQTFRPDFARNPSAAGTVSSATSMQIFNTTGQLRITNDPNEIPTPDVSRQTSRASHDTARSTAGTADANRESLSPSVYSSENQVIKQSAKPASSSNDGHSYLSTKSEATDQTADHYASEPQSSKTWLQMSRQHS